VLEDVLVRVDELIIPVDFLVVNSEDNEQVEHQLILGRPFMATTRMEIKIREGSITMMVLGKKLQLDAYNINSLPLYSSNNSNSCFDEDMMKQVKESLQIIRSQPWHNEVKRESKSSKGGRTIWVPKKNPKLFQYSKAKKKDFSTNSCQMLSSDFDDTGTLGRKEESKEETLDRGDEKKQKSSLRNLGDEDDKFNEQLNPNGDQGADPNNGGKDQQKGPP